MVCVCDIYQMIELSILGSSSGHCGMWVWQWVGMGEGCPGHD